MMSPISLQRPKLLNWMKEGVLIESYSTGLDQISFPVAPRFFFPEQGFWGSGKRTRERKCRRKRVKEVWIGHFFEEVDVLHVLVTSLFCRGYICWESLTALLISVCFAVGVSWRLWLLKRFLARTHIASKEGCDDWKEMTTCSAILGSLASLWTWWPQGWMKAGSRLTIIWFVVGLGGDIILQ